MCLFVSFVRLCYTVMLYILLDVILCWIQGYYFVCMLAYYIMARYQLCILTDYSQIKPELITVYITGILVYFKVMFCVCHALGKAWLAQCPSLS